jgi:hypothetical protein
MAVTATPIFVQTPRTWIQAVTAANTSRDGSGTIPIVVTAGANGSKIDHIDIAAYGTTTAGVIRLFISDGTTIMLWKEILVSAITPSATVAVWSYSLDCSQPQNSLVLTASTYLLRASTHNAENFRVIAVGGDF